MVYVESELKELPEKQEQDTAWRGGLRARAVSAVLYSAEHALYTNWELFLGKCLLITLLQREEG